MLYTRRGDSGYSNIFTGDGDLSKASDVFDVLGNLDELNSFLGLLVVKVSSHEYVELRKYSEFIEDVQNDLFIIQANVARAPQKIKKEKISWLEDIIDGTEKEIGPIKNFTIAGGTEASALFDIARAITRRVERSFIKLCDSGPLLVDETSKIYLNRLSSLFFAFARLFNSKTGTKEKDPDYR